MDCDAGDTVRRRARIATTMTGALVLAACGAAQPTGPAPEREQERASRVDPGRQGSLAEIFGAGPTGNTNVRLGAGGGEALIGAPVNRHIWRAAIDTLAFLPIASTDPYSGVIATDWGPASDDPEERVKVTAFVDDVALAPNSLRVAVFRQRRETGGAWVAAPVSAETARQVEDAILTRARQLRLQEEEQAG